MTKGGALSAKDLKTLLNKSYDKKPKDHGDWKVDKSLSGQRVQVYHNPKTNETVVAHRGTKGIHDIGNDIKYLFGSDLKDTKRYKHSENIQKLAEEKYGSKNISTIGHSLGAKLSEVGRNTKEIINLNKATGIQDLGKKTPENEYNVRTKLDPVSALLPLKKADNVLTIPSKTFNPLAEHTVDVLDRVDPNKMIGKGHVKKMKVKDLKEVIKKLPKVKGEPRFKVGKKSKSELVDYCCKRCNVE